MNWISSRQNSTRRCSPAGTNHNQQAPTRTKQIVKGRQQGHHVFSMNHFTLQIHSCYSTLFIDVDSCQHPQRYLSLHRMTITYISCALHNFSVVHSIKQRDRIVTSPPPFSYKEISNMLPCFWNKKEIHWRKSRTPTASLTLMFPWCDVVHSYSAHLANSTIYEDWISRDSTWRQSPFYTLQTVWESCV